jgi:hypothetical protein
VGWRGLVEGMLRFESGERVTAGEVSGFFFPFLLRSCVCVWSYWGRC